MTADHKTALRAAVAAWLGGRPPGAYTLTRGCDLATFGDGWPAEAEAAFRERGCVAERVPDTSWLHGGEAVRVVVAGEGSPGGVPSAGG